jgi:hypothetical protein
MLFLCILTRKKHTGKDFSGIGGNPSEEPAAGQITADPDSIFRKKITE